MESVCKRKTADTKTVPGPVCTYCGKKGHLENVCRAKQQTQPPVTVDINTVVELAVKQILQQQQV